MRFNFLLSSTIVAASAALLACADSTKAPAGRPVSVSFSTAASGGASRSLSFDGGASRSTTTVGSDVLEITKAQIVVARLELEREGANCGSQSAAGDDDVDDHECSELTLAPTVVDLPVDNAVVAALNVSIPEGTYSALEAKIRPVRAGDDRGKGSAAFLRDHPELAGVSVRVVGKFNGKDFAYSGTPRVEFETAFNPPLVVDTKPVNITVNVNTAKWFVTPSGSLIDPSTANAGGANEQLVRANIMRSFRAFRDRDRKGHDDDDRGGRS
jgi:hypothetical protein